MDNFLRVDGAPKIEKEKASIRAFLKERSRGTFRRRFQSGAGLALIHIERR